MARKTSLTIFDSYFFSMYRKDKRQSWVKLNKIWIEFDCFGWVLIVKRL
jgi:hypothetical protein